MVIKQFNCAAFLGFRNVIGPNGSNSDSETSDFAGVVMLKKYYSLIYKHLFHHVSLWEKVFLGPIVSRDIVITQFGRYVKLTSQLAAVLGVLWCCAAHWICMVVFPPMAPPTSSHSAHRLYIVMTSRISTLFLARGKFYKHKTSMDQKFITERVITDVVCSSRRHGNSFTDVSFITAVYGENAFWAARGFFAAIPRVATGKNWLQDWAIQLLLDIHGNHGDIKEHSCQSLWSFKEKDTKKEKKETKWRTSEGADTWRV